MRNNMSSTPQPSTERATSKLAYHAPVVQEFGNIRAMTQSAGPTGANDGANNGVGNPKNKTRA